jgi:ATP-dependent Lhr-like helicase
LCRPILEVFECRVAIDAVAENAQDTPPCAPVRSMFWRSILGRACGEPFWPISFMPKLPQRPMPTLHAWISDATVDLLHRAVTHSRHGVNVLPRSGLGQDGRWRITHRA